jgi:hydrogenase 3 maturation protease
MWRKMSRELVKEIMKEGKRPSLVILCIGNEERGDDAFGPYIAKRLRRARKRGIAEVIDCGTVPENYTDVVRRIRPTHVIIVDAVDFKGSPGDIILSFEPTFDEVSVSTHKPSLTLLAKYIQSDIGSKIILLGVQPKSVDWGSSMSDEVLAASEVVVKAFKSAIRRIRETLKKEARA